MSTLAVSVTDIDGPKHTTVQGILTAMPKLGSDCRIYLGGNQEFRIVGVKGWIGPSDGKYLIIFDREGYRFKVEQFASSKDFLL